MSDNRPVTLVVWHTDLSEADKVGAISTMPIPIPPPPGGCLTVADLRGWERDLGYAIRETDFDGDGNPAVVALRDRLRAALDAVGAGKETP